MDQRKRYAQRKNNRRSIVKAIGELPEVKEVDIKDILYTISTWQVESSSGHNDGWTVEHY